MSAPSATLGAPPWGEHGRQPHAGSWHLEAFARDPTGLYLQCQWVFVVGISRGWSRLAEGAFSLWCYPALPVCPPSHQFSAQEPSSPQPQLPGSRSPISPPPHLITSGLGVPGPCPSCNLVTTPRSEDRPAPPGTGAGVSSRELIARGFLSSSLLPPAWLDPRGQEGAVPASTARRRFPHPRGAPSPRGGFPKRELDAGRSLPTLQVQLPAVPQDAA